MESINLWITELCVCAAAVAIAENLLPEGNVKKTVYFVLGLVVVTCFVSPIENFRFSETEINPNIDLNTENTDWLNRTTEEIFKSNVEALVKKQLSGIGVETKNIDIHTDIDGDNSIFIDKVRITVSSDYTDRIDEIADEIYKNLGMDTDVIVR